jgi:hypothetical protein
VLQRYIQNFSIRIFDMYFFHQTLRNWGGFSQQCCTWRCPNVKRMPWLTSEQRELLLGFSLSPPSSLQDSTSAYVPRARLIQLTTRPGPKRWKQTVARFIHSKKKNEKSLSMNLHRWVTWRALRHTQPSFQIYLFIYAYLQVTLGLSEKKRE